MYCLCGFCNDMIIASARFKEKKVLSGLCNSTLQRGVCLCGWGRAHDRYERKSKKISLKCYSMSWKAVRKLPNVHIDLFLKSQFVTCSLRHVLLWHILLRYKHPLDSHASYSFETVVAGSLDVSGDGCSAVENDVSADTKTVFLDLWPCYFTEQREETHRKGTLVYFVKLKIWSPLSITCKKKTYCTLVWPLSHVK